jgi:hypothetical protein
MPADSVTEIDAPRKTGSHAVGIVGQAAAEASDAANSHAYGERYRKQVASAARYADPLLRPLHRQRSTQKSADDRLARHQVDGIVPVMERGEWIFEPVQNLAADRSAADRRRDDPHAAGIGQEIAAACPVPAIELKTNQVCQ